MTDPDRRELERLAYGRPGPAGSGAADEDAAMAAARILQSRGDASRSRPSSPDGVESAGDAREAAGDEARDEARSGEPATDSPWWLVRPTRRPTRRSVLLGGVAATAAVALAIVWSIVSAPEPSLAVFEREQSAVERDHERLLVDDGFVVPGARPEVRLLLEFPTGRSDGTLHRVWGFRLDQGRSFSLGARGVESVCLLVDSGSASGSASAASGGCMAVADFERRGFIPLDSPRPLLFLDGVQKTIQWGPTGEARVIDVPVPPSESPAPESRGS